MTNDLVPDWELQRIAAEICRVIVWLPGLRASEVDIKNITWKQMSFFLYEALIETARIVLWLSGSRDFSHTWSANNNASIVLLTCVAPQLLHSHFTN